jgi:hypothetical protein
MKNLLFLLRSTLILFFAVMSTSLSSQIVEIESTTDGFLPPRMTTAEREAITDTSASDGMIIFNIDTGRLNYYDGYFLQWRELHPGAHSNVIDYFRFLPNGIQTLLDAGETPINIINEGADTSAFIGLNYNGATNTITVLNASCDSTGSAFVYVNTLSLDGYTDWFLPSKDELYEMYKNLYRYDCSAAPPGGSNASACTTSLGGFAGLFYWSSSESDGNSAGLQDFNFGNQYYLDKRSFDRVRAIRAF